MNNSQECVESIMIDVCRKSFRLFSDQGDVREVNCENSEQFMNVLEVVTANLSEDKIMYADLIVYENSND